MSVTRAAVLNVVILAVTLVVVGIVLVAGKAEPEQPSFVLTVGQPSPQNFVNDVRSLDIEDVEATQAARDQARRDTPTVFSQDNLATTASLRDVNAFFVDLKASAFYTAEDVPPELITTTSTTVAETTTTTAVEAGEEPETTTTTTTTQPTTTTTTTLPRRLLDEQVEMLQANHARISLTTIQSFVLLYNVDLDRVDEGETATFPAIEVETDRLARRELDNGIKAEELGPLQDAYINPITRPPIFISGLSAQEQPMASDAVAELVARNLQTNLRVDTAATEAQREANAAAVEPIVITYGFGDTIALEGDLLTGIEVQAIDQLGLIAPEPTGPSTLAMAVVGAIAVLLAAFFLWRIAPTQWSRPRHFALLGVLLVLAALISRMPELVSAENPQLAYVMPVMAIGFLSAILFDPRTAVLMAIPMAGFTAISTQDLGLTVYAAGATVIPVGFVSSVSSRRQLRLAVVASAGALAPLAAAIEWLFGEGFQSSFEAAAWAFLGGLVAGFIAMGLVSFLENAFGITTTLALLDLVDRNHPALRVLEEQAPGTFNHSILVGTLAGKAARSIGADPLLSQAAAWYHDLGKTENPQFFIENQFGVSNPHDELPPEESAEIIRAHVTDGLRLARQFRIPGDVAEGIRAHHGTGLMRYFYHKALETDPGVAPSVYRHHGVKPRRKEMAILMISDAVEGAARALSQEEDPTAEGLKKLVDSVVGEKLDDGQLDNSELTFGDLTLVKEEMVRALTGYYHTRVPYPGFPGSKVEES